MTALSEVQKQDILLDVKRRVDHELGEYVSTGICAKGLKSLDMVFKQAGQDLKDVANLTALEVLNETKNVCVKLNMSEVQTAYTLDNWAAEASKLLGLTQSGYPDYLN